MESQGKQGGVGHCAKALALRWAASPFAICLTLTQSAMNLGAKLISISTFPYTLCRRSKRVWLTKQSQMTQVKDKTGKKRCHRSEQWSRGDCDFSLRKHRTVYSLRTILPLPPKAGTIRWPDLIRHPTKAGSRGNSTAKSEPHRGFYYETNIGADLVDDFSIIEPQHVDVSQI